MPNFYKDFPKIDYKFADGTTQKLTDTNIKYNLTTLVKNTTDVFYPFGWRDSDRPDSLANKYYDSDNFYWLVLMSNDVYDVNHDLPMRADDFYKYLVVRYKDEAMAEGLTENLEDVLGYCSQTIHHYEDKDGDVIDLQAFTELGDTKAVSIFDYEFKLNESKRAIRLLEASRKNQIQYELEDKLRKLKSET